MALAECQEAIAHAATALAALLQTDLLRLNRNNTIDPNLKKALCTLAEAQVFKEIISVKVWSTSDSKSGLNIFAKPKQREVREDYTGSDHRYAMVRTGDQVIVYGEDGEESIIFNGRNRSIGRVPSRILAWTPSETKLECVTFTSRENYSGAPSSGYFLSWKVGMRILVCHWEDSKAYRGIGVNLSTGKTGRFEICSRNCALDR